MCAIFDGMSFFIFLQHPFMQGNLSVRLTKDLLDKMNSPNLQNEEPEDDEPEVQLLYYC